MLWTKPLILGTRHVPSHQSLNSLFGKSSRRLSPNHAILVPFLQNCCTYTLMFSSLSPTSSTLHWLLVLYHQTSKLLSNPCSKNLPRSKCTEKLLSNLKPAISVKNSSKGRSTQTSCTPPRKQPLQSFPIILPQRTQHRDRTPTRCKRLVKRYG